MDRERVRTIAGIGLGVVLVVGFGLSRVLGGATGGGGSDGTAAACEEPIAWSDAASVVGERAAVAGPVAAASYEPDVGGSPTFLNLGNAHPDDDRFDAIIYEDVRDRMQEAPEEVFPGLQVCIHGEVRDRDGVPQIIVDHPSDITRP
jgi:hypothetical protein